MSVYTDTVYFPEWTEQNLALPESSSHRGASQDGSMSAVGDGQEYHEFLLSCNWVLRPAGLREFFSEFSKHSLKSEMTWDTTLGCFRVRSPSGEGSKFMVAVRDILDRMVQPEIDHDAESEGYGTFGGQSSQKIQHASEWRAVKLGEDEWREYDQYAYPRELMEMGHRDTWHMPGGQVSAGVSLTRVLPKNRLLEELQKSSGCTVLVGLDGKSLQIGGATENAIEVVKKKVERLLKYYNLSSESDVSGRHVLYAGSEVVYMAEMRYIAHLNEGLLSTIFLDRTRYTISDPATTTYSKVFSRGCVVSKALYNYASKDYQSTPHSSIAPAFEKSKAASVFLPFKGYSYTAKTSTWIPDDSSAHHSQLASAVLADFSNVNPQAAPGVAPWAKKTALESGRDEDYPGLTNDSLHPPQEAKLGGAHEIDPFGTHSSMTASPQTTNASSLQIKANPRDLLDSPVRAGQDGLGHHPLNDSQASLVSFSPEKGSEPAVVSWSMAPLAPVRRIVDGEQKSREFHATMDQRAPSRRSKSRSTQSSTAQKPDPNPEVIGKVSNKLVKILEPLRMFQGTISLKAELGRFIFINVNHAHISLPHGGNGPPRRKSPDEMETGLGGHSEYKAPIFTRVVSLSGGDMNYINDLREPGDASSRTWKPLRKSVIYEFRCKTSTVGKKSRACFIIDVNAEDFSFRIRPDPKDGSQCGVFMHCLSRTFDIQFTVETAPYLPETCRAFAQELVDSLTVKTNGTGVPELSFINHGDWHAGVRTVRVRRTAVSSNVKHQCQLEVTQVGDMRLEVVSHKDKVNYLIATEGQPRPDLGVFPVFYEACIKSSVAERAFAENKSLEFAEEAEWTAKDLKAADVFKDLVTSATDLVKQMDGVGSWCDNHQKAMVHGRPPMSTAEERRRAEDQSGGQYTYW
ncbi:hypothetical protein PG991_002222 [Apiospora marii]|uniref:K Homology domain-containing protein n=1 Tax=Apiospora marii TaxID=335849 RepID=A0ABR1SGE6_9PEZI